MEVKRNKPEPVEVPPDTIDITGLTLREAGALRELLSLGITWDRQADDLYVFFRDLCFALPPAPVNLNFSDLHDAEF